MFLGKNENKLNYVKADHVNPHEVKMPFRGAREYSYRPGKTRHVSTEKSCELDHFLKCVYHVTPKSQHHLNSSALKFDDTYVKAHM